MTTSIEIRLIGNVWIFIETGWEEKLIIEKDTPFLYWNNIPLLCPAIKFSSPFNYKVEYHQSEVDMYAFDISRRALLDKTTK